LLTANEVSEDFRNLSPGCSLGDQRLPERPPPQFEILLVAIRRASIPFSRKSFSLDIEVRVTIIFLLLLCLLWMLLGTIASAQPTEALPPVVVTGPAESLTSPDLNSVAERFHDMPGAVSVYSSAHYQLGRGSYLEDFLPYAPGVLIQSSQGSEDTKVSVRGSGAQEDNTIGLGILLDGMPLNQGDGEAFLHDLDLRSVKYAEVYRGADALRYRSITLGGAINLVTAVAHRDWRPANRW
jgi:outer membrane receptor protein involved in Fe transport